MNGSEFLESFVDDPSSIDYSAYEELDVSISPNPSTGPIQISSNQNLIDPVINIYNNLGQLIRSEKSLSANITIPVGQYFIQIIDEKQKLYKLEKIEVIR